MAYYYKSQVPRASVFSWYDPQIYLCHNQYSIHYHKVSKYCNSWKLWNFIQWPGFIRYKIAVSVVNKLNYTLRTCTILHLNFFKCIIRGNICMFTMYNIFITYTHTLVHTYTNMHHVHAFLCTVKPSATVF